GREVVAVGTFPLAAGAGVYGFGPQTGARRWWFQFDSPSLLSSPVIAGRDVLVGLNDGRLAAVDAVTGHEVWEGKTGAGPLGPIALAGDLVVVSKAGDRGGLVAFRTNPSGHLIDVTSRTKLDLAVSLRNYAVTFLALAAGVQGHARPGSARNVRGPARAVAVPAVPHHHGSSRAGRSGLPGTGGGPARGRPPHVAGDGGHGSRPRSRGDVRAHGHPAHQLL